MMNGGAVASALTKCVLEANWSVVLLEEIAERLVGQLLECFHLIPREQVHCLPRLLIELHALAGHISGRLVILGASRPRVWAVLVRMMVRSIRLLPRLV